MALNSIRMEQKKSSNQFTAQHIHKQIKINRYTYIYRFLPYTHFFLFLLGNACIAFSHHSVNRNSSNNITVIVSWIKSMNAENGWSLTICQKQNTGYLHCVFVYIFNVFCLLELGKAICYIVCVLCHKRGRKVEKWTIPWVSISASPFLNRIIWQNLFLPLNVFFVVFSLSHIIQHLDFFRVAPLSYVVYACVILFIFLVYRLPMLCLCVLKRIFLIFFPLGFDINCTIAQ